ncbi:MAG: tRNA (adenosine(37)-N6)-threonylcarbamoyltransferase complex dimerization subunit type 1 TsaB [Actinomycetota bacterium]
MKVLAIETATAQSGVALAEDRTVVAAASRVDRMGHATFLVPAIEFCFDQVGWFPDDLDAIAVDLGPGLYTGIRVGIATAQGMASALGIPVVAGSSLDALALEAATGHRHIFSVVDVRRGELAVATYRPVPGGAVRDGEAELMAPDRLRSVLMGDPVDPLVVGDVPALPDEVLRGLHRVRTGRPRYPSARALIQLGLSKLDKDAFPVEAVRPLYMREPDIDLNWSKLTPEGPWSVPS